MNRQDKLDWLCRNVQPSQFGVFIDADRNGRAIPYYCDGCPNKPIHPDDMTPPFEGEIKGFDAKQESDMKIDIERLKTDRAYWDECDPTNGEATHFYPVTEDWYVIEGQTERAWRPEEGLINAAYWKARQLHAIPRPEPQWVDGLPPVGVECESALHGAGYQVGQITYLSDQVLVWRDKLSGQEYATRSTSRKFRPIPSPRDAWVAEAQKHCTEFCSKQLGHVYDALASGDLEVPK